MSKLRIGLLGNCSSAHIHRIALTLQARGHDVILFTGSRHMPEFSLVGVEVRVYESDLSFPRKLSSLRKLIDSAKIDVLHSHYVNHGGYAGFLSGFHPHVISAWGDDLWLTPKSSRGQMAMTQATLRSADLNLAVSASLDAEIARLTRGHARSTIWHWGINTKLFSRDRAKAKEFRQSIGVKEGELLVYSPRLLWPDYYHEWIVEAWPQIVKAFPQARLMLKRTGGRLDYENILRKKAESLGFADRLIWIENLPLETLPVSLSAADAVVSLPVTEGTPMTILETFACETPVAAVDIPEVRDWVRESETGALMQSNADSVAQAVIRILNLSHEERTEMGKHARSQVVARAEKERCFDRLEEIYSSVCREKSGFSWIKTLRNLVRSQ